MTTLPSAHTRPVAVACAHSVPGRSLPIGSLSALRQLLDAAIPWRRVQLLATLVLTVFGAIAELVTIGAVLPVLAIAANPDAMDGLPVVGPFLSALSVWLSVGPVVAAALFLTVAAIGATVVRLTLMWASQKFVFGIQQDLLMEIFGRSLRQPYSWYLKQNSSVLISSQAKIAIVIGGVITPLINAFSAAVMALCMTIFLFVLDPGAAFVASVSIGLTYLAITLYARRKARTMSEGLASVHGARVRMMQETLGGIRDINLDQSQPVFEERLLRIENEYRHLAGLSNFIQFAPRLLVEGVAIMLVAVMAAWFSLQPGGVLAAIPVLGALGLGAQRMLPMIQIVYHGYATYSLYAHNLGDVVALLNTPVERIARIGHDQVKRFATSVELRDVTFSYDGDSSALADVNLTIAKGERVGFIGKTGSGKSTLVDVVMGLLPPTTGALIVDGEPIDHRNIGNWKAQIAHVPQAIFLTDDTMAANIAFGVRTEQIDSARVARAAEEAGLGDFIGQLAAGLDTSVGERGVRLSGGQRQRIGIARALYKNATVLVLDEATSALDDETEAEVMQSVAELRQDLTVILIAHRLSTVANCDRIYRLDAGRIVEQGSYAEVIDHNAATDAVVGRGGEG